MLIFKDIFEKASLEWSQAADVEMSCLLYRVTTMLFLAQSSQKKFDTSLKYIREHYYSIQSGIKSVLERDFRMATLSPLAGVSPPTSSALSCKNPAPSLNPISDRMQYYAETIRLDDLAQVACMSRYHFAHAFQEEFGLTPMEYINKYRMERAQYLWHAVKLCVSDIRQSQEMAL